VFVSDAGDRLKHRASLTLSGAVCYISNLISAAKAVCRQRLNDLLADRDARFAAATFGGRIEVRTSPAMAVPAHALNEKEL